MGYPISMFRKRKEIAPFFRMPNPTNVVTGDAHYLFPPLKQYCRFVLTEALTTSDESAKAELTTPHQWGPSPIYHCPEIIIHVHNLEDRERENAVSGSSTLSASPEAPTYLFSGGIGDVGFAAWDHDNHWRIVHMRGGLVGGCLDEDHPGRGIVFNVRLGTWNSETTKWEYSASAAAVKGIDWRYGAPYPTGNATGLFEARASDEYGTIWEVVSLDCESPGICGS